MITIQGYFFHIYNKRTLINDSQKFEAEIWGLRMVFALRFDCIIKYNKKLIFLRCGGLDLQIKLIIAGWLEGAGNT
jgi:hypothetical protein